MFQCCLQRVIWMWSVCGSVHYTHCSLVDSAQNGLRVTVSTRTQCSHHSELQRSRNIVLLCGQFTRTCPSPFFFFLFTIGFSAHPSFTPPPKFVVSSHPPSPCGFVVQRERCKIAPLEHLVLTVEEGGFLPRQRQWQRAAPLKRYGYMLHLPAKIVESSLGIIQSTA